MCDGMAGEPLPCCGKRLCGSCVTNLLDYRFETDWYIRCPFCQKESGVSENRVKHLLAKNCTHHSKTLGEPGGVVVHMPNNAGHYDHPDSYLLVGNVADDTETELLFESLEAGNAYLREQNGRLLETNGRLEAQVERLLEGNRQLLRLVDYRRQNRQLLRGR